MDDDVDALEETISAAVETARFAPARRGGQDLVARYEATMPQLDSAVRDTRVLARYAARQVRHGRAGARSSPAPCASSPTRSGCSPRTTRTPSAAATSATRRSRAARTAEDIHDRHPSLLTTQIVAQVRSVAVDLVRAAEQLGGDREGPPAWDLPTEELLAV